MHDYDCCNGMWGETDDEKKWNFIPALSMSAILIFTPIFTAILALAISQNIPKDLKPAFC